MDLADIAKCYLEGVGVEKNVPKAISYLQKAAKKREPTAMSLLGEIYLLGHFGMKDEKEGIRLIKEAAEYDDERALSLLARCYEIGYGVEMNAYQSIDYLERFYDITE